jgi:hypothetical protein
MKARSARWLAVTSILIAAAGHAQEARVLPEWRSTAAPLAHVIAPEAAVAVSANPCVEREPNEQPPQASPMLLPTTCSGSVSFTDASAVRIQYDGGITDGIEDVFVVTLPTAGQPTFELSYPNATADLDLFLFTVSGTTVRFLAISAREQDGVSERILVTNPLPAGTYYVGVSAFSGSSSYALVSSSPGYSETCTPDATSLCLNNGRFRVQTEWRTSDNRSGNGQGVLMTGDTGYFWFFGQSNVEVVVKLLDACSLNQRYWVFAGGLTDVQVKLKVTDTITNATREYNNPLGTAYVPVTHTGAFACSTTPPPCTYAAAPSTQDFGSAAGNGQISVTAGAGCAWTASSNASFITITAGGWGSGNGSVSYAVAANSGASSRSGTISVAGQTVTITQSGASATCTYTVTPTSQQFAASAGSGLISVTTTPTCSWTATTFSSFITITSGASGTGTGSVSYSVAANSGISSRTGTLTVAGRTVTITQDAGATTCSYNVSFPTRQFTWCGGDAQYTLTKTNGCGFNVSADQPWIHPILVQAGASGTTEEGSFALDPNTSTSPRTGNVTIAGQSFPITQPGRSGSGQYDGIWSGTTDGNRPVTACVANNAIESVRVTVRMNFTTFSCTSPLVRIAPLPISGSSFTGSIANYLEVSNIFTTLTGSFPSNTSMTGSWPSFSQGYYVVCGSTVGVGSGGVTLPAGSFNATKQP